MGPTSACTATDEVSIAVALVLAGAGGPVGGGGGRVATPACQRSLRGLRSGDGQASHALDGVAESMTAVSWRSTSAAATEASAASIFALRACGERCVR